MFGQSDVQRVEHNVGNGSDINTLNVWGCSDMEKESVPGAEDTRKYNIGGEVVNSSELMGKQRIFENQHFSSPPSKKISQSVATFRKMSLASSEKGGRGVAEPNGVTASEIQYQKKQENKHDVVVVQTQNWRQKLLAFRAENP